MVELTLNEIKKKKKRKRKKKKRRKEKKRELKERIEEVTRSNLNYLTSLY